MALLAAVIGAGGLGPAVRAPALLPGPAVAAEPETAEPESAEPESVEAEPDLDEARDLLRRGEYARCVEETARGLDVEPDDEGWMLVRLRAQLAIGDWQGAVTTLEEGLQQQPYSIRLRWEGRAAWRATAQAERAAQAMREIETLVRRLPYRYRGAEDRAVIGRYLLDRGADARQVLEEIYDRARESSPDSAALYLAAADLALAKQDLRVAAAELARARELAPDEPDILWRVARAHASSDAEAFRAALDAALEINPRHVESLLLLVDGAIDREAYEEADELLQRILDVCPDRPEAHAYRAVLAHLRGDEAGEAVARAAALGAWSTNPEVDHLIGRKLSQKYRFAEGAVCQRRALAFDPLYLPAKMQLCQDLLRLGEEEAGWRLASEVFAADAYSVLAHNLATLRDHLQGFRTLEAEGLVLRMDADEAAVYGGRALALLRSARESLCARYDVELDRPVVVEIFPEQKDFAVRTFGIPGVAGFLGVCFGAVITANSPASRGEQPSSWEAVLWHEFCHVVTLAKTRNRMPRWLSEGISVWEERRRDPTWGQSMTLRYARMVEEGDFAPLSRLSAAFLQPPSPLHLQFAYFESALAVEFIVERKGFEALLGILDDLGEGTAIGEALTRRVGPLETIDRDFEAFLTRRAVTLLSRADWTPPELPEGAGPEAVDAYVTEHPDCYPGLELQARLRMAAERWEDAKGPIERLIELDPTGGGAESPYVLLALVHRELGESDAERRALLRVSEIDADVVAPRLRLIELLREAEAWEDLERAADRLIAVSPLIEAPHRALVEARERLGRPQRAVESYRALLHMEPVDPAGLRLRLARALRGAGDRDAARRQVLMALEEAPRFRDAHRELLSLIEEASEP